MRAFLGAVALAAGIAISAFAAYQDRAETGANGPGAPEAMLSDPTILTSRDYTRILQQFQKPAPQRPGDARPAGYTGDDSCRHANDGECDDPGIGTGACTAGTDYSDCWRIVSGQEDDSCRWANDGECDEPGFGTGACTQGTDVTDCGDVTHLRFRNDSCEFAFDGVCDEPGTGTGRCPARTDRSDCGGRHRPLTINDHFFGNDDRVMMDTAQFPWSVIGTIQADRGGTCTATLVAPNVIATAAHCIHSEGQLYAGGVFTTGFALPGGPRTARVVDHLIDEEWDSQRFSQTDEIDGTDWALLRLDQPLGDELGHVGVLDIVADRSEREVQSARIWQAGYSWDTGSNLSGNEDCRILIAYPDDTISHDCDTTRGDSGSPFMVYENGEWQIIATDSNFRSNPDGPFIYISSRSSRWAHLLDDFAAGRIGAGGVRPQGPGKPGAPVAIKSGG
ncbi:trypsin-like serine protease [Synechococcus moorigangaii CMS01]|nr:trypsin-like serine protease [Synechococcus moorigangaii CMS01]